ncbi:MAG: hypothetical protein JZD40_00470, partial [Sulfolobus sp.]|nr:hypothetical protein [Sulfolobus sp.]
CENCEASGILAKIIETIDSLLERIQECESRTNLLIVKHVLLSWTHNELPIPQVVEDLLKLNIPKEVRDLLTQLLEKLD